jgi:hypothetical protein
VKQSAVAGLLQQCMISTTGVKNVGICVPATYLHRFFPPKAVIFLASFMVKARNSHSVGYSRPPKKKAVFFPDKSCG